MEQRELRGSKEQARRSLGDQQQRKQRALEAREEPPGRKSSLGWDVSQRETETNQAPR